MAKKSVEEEPQQIPDSTTPPPNEEVLAAGRELANNPNQGLIEFATRKTLENVSSQESPVVPQEQPQLPEVRLARAMVRGVPYMELPLTGYVPDRIDGGEVSEKAAQNAKKIMLGLEATSARLHDGSLARGYVGVVRYLLENVQFE